MLSQTVSKKREALKGLLSSYQSTFEAEYHFKDSMLALLVNPSCFERSLLHAHFTASAWVVDEHFGQALLTHHAKLDRWLQLGGHADGEEDLALVAQKELVEESGLAQAKFYSNAIFDLDIHTIPARKGVPQHEHYDVRFLFVANREEKIVFNHESKEVTWVPMKSIPSLCNGNDSIVRMIQKTENLRTNSI